MKFFLSCCFICIAALLSAQRPELIARQDGHNSEVYHVCFSPNGKQALSADRENRIVLWDLAAGKFVRAIPTESQAVLLSYSADGQQAIGLLEDGTLNAWNLATGERRWQLPIATTPLLTAKVSANRRYLAVAFVDAPISCWDLTVGRQVWKDQTLRPAPANLHFATGDAVLVARDSIGNVLTTWQTSSGKDTSLVLNWATSFANLAWIGPGKGLVTQDNQVRLLDYQAGLEVNLPGLGQVLSLLDIPISDFSLSRNGTRLAIALGIPTFSFSVSPGLPGTRQGRGGLLFWDTQKDQSMGPGIDLPEIVNEVVLSADGSRCLTASSDQTVRLWDVLTGQELQRMEPDPQMEHAFSITPDFRTLGMTNYDGYFKSWDLQQWSDLQVRLPGYDLSGAYSERDFDCFTLSNDGEYLLTGSRNSSLHLWNTSPLTHLGKLTDRHNSHWVTTALAISPDGKKALVGSADEWRVLSQKIFKIEPKTVRKYLTNDNQDTIGIRTKDGTIIEGWLLHLSGELYLAPDYNNVSLWDLETQESIRVFYSGTGDRGRTTKLRFSPDGQLAIGNGEAWNIDSQRPLTNADGIDHFDAVYVDTQSALAATISPERRQVSLWTLPDGVIRGRLSSSTPLAAVGIHPAGGKLCTLDSLGVLTEWDLATGQPVRRILGLGQGTSLVYAPQHNLVEVWNNASLALWNLDTGKRVLDLGKKDAQSGYVGQKFFDYHQPAEISMFSWLPDGFRALAASYDGTLRLWDTRTGREIATLYFPGFADWVVTTPSGLFDASPGALESLYFRVGTEIIDLEQLKERYYEPGLLQKLLGFASEPIRSVEDFQAIALYPEVDLRLDTASNQLHIQLHPRNGGVGKVSVFVNGKEIIQEANPPQGSLGIRDTLISVSLAEYARYFLQDSLNTVGVRAYNSAGWLKSAAQEVSYYPRFPYRGLRGNISASTSGGRPVGNRKPALYALMVGTADYAGTAIDLKYSGKDARDMANAIQQVARQLFLDSVFVTLLTTDTSVAAMQPTKANILAAFDQIQKRAKAEDILVVYFSGHGVSYGDADQALFYYLTKDIASQNLSDAGIRNSRAISSAELTEWIKAIPALKQIMIIDACNSGRALDNLVGGRKELSASQVRAFDRMKDRTGMFVLTGSAADMVSYEASQYGQGLLTYSLLQGMSGFALGEGQRVDVSTLFQYACDRVRELAKSIGGIQTPMQVGSTQGSFDIGIFNDAVQIPLAQEKPVFIRSFLQDQDNFGDGLGLNQALTDYFELLTVKGAQAPIIYADVNAYSDAYSIKGLYQLKSGVVTVRGRLFKGQTSLGEFKVSGKQANLRALVEEIVDQAVGLME